jgi:Tol biopolymer transport system component/DNA-binding SARP family transcriptional activator
VGDGLVTLRMLGGVELTGPDGQPVRSILTQPSRLALLLYLSTTNSGRFHRKDTVRAVFWPEADAQHARQALNRAIYVLRQALGAEVLVTRGDDEVRVVDDRLRCDVVQFEKALDSGAPEAALELYRGELAPGFLVSGLPDFERWMDAERGRLRERALEAAIRLTEEEERRGRLELAARWAARAALLAPYDELTAARHISLLDRIGDRAAALRAYEDLRRRLQEDLEVDPSPETVALIDAVRARRESRRAPPPETRPATTEPALVTPRRAISRRHLIGGAVTVALLGLVAARLLRSHPLALTTANAIRLTSEPGIEYQPALSPDGSMVAFTTVKHGHKSISVRSAAGGPSGGEVQVTRGETEDEGLSAWSADGELVRYVSEPRPATFPRSFAMRSVSRLGGPVRTVPVPRFSRSIAWTRDDTRAAFVSNDSLFTYRTADPRPRLLTVQGGTWRPHSLTWSPDGRWIAYVYGNNFWTEGWNLAPATVWLIDPESGQLVQVSDETHLNVSPAWLDDHHLLFISDRDGPRELYLVTIGADGPRGTPVKVPGGTDAHSISISRDGRRLALAKLIGKQNVWSFPLPGSRPLRAGDGRPVTTDVQIVETHDVSTDGRWLVYDSNLQGDVGMYRMRLDGGTPAPVAAGPLTVGFPHLSPDGREIAFYAGASMDIWVVSAEGGTPTQLTNTPDVEENPIWAPDGLSVVYRASQRGRGEAWIVTRDRIGAPWNAPRLLVREGCAFQVWAHDGRGLICGHPGRTTLTMVDRTGATVWQRDLAVWGLSKTGAPVLSPDGTTLYLGATSHGQIGIWALPLAGGTPRLAIPLDDPSLVVHSYPGTINVTRDRLYLTVGEYESDIWVMDLVRR